MSKRTSTILALKSKPGDYQHPALQVLRDSQLKFATMDQQPERLLLGMTGSHGNFTVACVHEPDTDLLRLHVAYPIRSTANAVNAVLRLLNHLNANLPGAGYALNLDDGEIYFRHCVHLDRAGQVNPDAFVRALALSSSALDYALPLIASAAQCGSGDECFRDDTNDSEAN
jgi:hypothetical protein